MDNPNQPYNPNTDTNRFPPPHNPPPSTGPPPPVEPTNDDEAGLIRMNNDDEAGPSGTKEENVDFQWVPPDTLDCSNCNILCHIEDQRNGLYNIAMSIHGVPGNLEHILVGVENTDSVINIDIDTYYFDLVGKSIESANEILSKYAFQIGEDGEIILQDSLLTIYNKILEELMTKNKPTHFPEYSSDSSGENWLELEEEEEEEEEEESEEDDEETEVDEPNPQEPGAANPRPPRPPRPSIAVQRERTANMTLTDLAPYFHLKAQDAAIEVNLSTTTLKLVCRRLHLWRWPYRKIQSIDKMIESLVDRLEAKAQAGDTNGVVALRMELRRQRERRARFYHFIIHKR